MEQQILLLDRKGNPCAVNVENLVAIRPTARGPEFYTKDEVYFYPTRMDELHLLLKNAGFERLDRTNLVNLNRVKAFDPKDRKVYFEYPWRQDSLSFTVSEANLKKVEHLAKDNEVKPSAVRDLLCDEG